MIKLTHFTIQVSRSSNFEAPASGFKKNFEEPFFGEMTTSMNFRLIRWERPDHERLLTRDQVLYGVHASLNTEEEADDN